MDSIIKDCKLPIDWLSKLNCAKFSFGAVLDIKGHKTAPLS